MNTPNHSRIYCYPFDSGTNEYINSCKRIWGSIGYKVLAAPVNLQSCFDIGVRRKDYLILNWFEDGVSSSKHPLLNFSRSIILLFIFKCQFKDIYWVRHNFLPHAEKNIILYEILCFFLSRLCRFTITHRVIQGTLYIPHPLYKTTIKPTCKQVKEVSFLYFGAIKNYKGIMALLENWPLERELLLVGLCTDDHLVADINNTILLRKLKVVWENQFKPLAELELLLAKTSCVILPHHDRAMIVSGAFFHAISFGANILMRESGFSHAFRKKFSFITEFNDSNLQAMLAKQCIISSENVVTEAYAECGDAVIARRWQQVFSLE